MKTYKSVRNSFKDCPFTIILPKVSVTDAQIHISFNVNFIGKSKSVKYIVKECVVTDTLGNKACAEPNENLSLRGNIKQDLIAQAKPLLKSQLTIAITIFTIDGDCIDVTYQYRKNENLTLERVALSDMTEDDKNYFMSTLNSSTKQNKVEIVNRNSISTTKNDFDEYIDALSNEMYFLKNNGGQKHKITDGRLLTSNSNEFCYSFELESELYLSDDAPISVIIGIRTISGSVISCDGFQIIVTLSQNIGRNISSAYLSVEPWKLLEVLRDRIKDITPSDNIAWRLYHAGPGLAEKITRKSHIKCGQESAITHALDEEITVIWGPPGTGKTYTMAQIAQRFVAMNKSVLIVSHSNISVDNVVKQLSNQFSDTNLNQLLIQGKVLRYGYVRDEELSKNDNCVAFNYALNNHPKLKEQYQAYSKESYRLKTELQHKQDSSKAIKYKEIEKELKNIRHRLKVETKTLTDKAQIVATTVSKLYMDNLFESKKYDVVMFDEISMAYVPQLLCAATFAKERFICVGDFRQLSPIVQNEKAKDILQKDIFMFLNICKHNEINNHPWLVMLNEQRRMHPHISEFSNGHIYKGLLKNHESVLNKWNKVTEKEVFENHAVTLVDLAGTFCAASKNDDNSRFNIVSALLSFALALKSEKAQADMEFKQEEKVGIITPYAAQTRLVRAIIQDYRQNDTTAISCATVHQFQGSERNVIVFDAVESYPFVKPGWLVSKNENGSVVRLINVALTRARCKFITLANTRFWNNKFHETQNTYFKLLEHITAKNNVVNMHENALLKLIQKMDFGKNIKVFCNAKETIEVLLKDIKSAKNQIIITMPTDKLNTQYQKLIYDAVKEKAEEVAVIVKAKESENLNEAWKNIAYISGQTSFPLIAIDSKIIWYGFPLSELFFEDKTSKFLAPNTPIFRITGKHTNEILHSLCDLNDNNVSRVSDLDYSKKIVVSAGLGLNNYIQNKEKCKMCGSPMRLYKGTSGKYCLKCCNCNSFSMLPVQVVNNYLDMTNATCSVCDCDLYAGTGKYGIYVKCSHNHFSKLSEI